LPFRHSISCDEMKAASQRGTYMRPSLKDNHLMLRTLTIREGADGLRGLVFEAGQ
jgi:hypothetical protein